jgi:hypothetical protein
MKIGSELTEWLQDRSAQRRARAEAETVASAWNDGPINSYFAQAMANCEGRGGQAVATVIAAIFADDRILDGLVETLAASLREDVFFEAPFRSTNSEIHSGLVLFEDDSVIVGAGVTSAAKLAEKKLRTAGQGAVCFSGHIELFKFVKSGGARLSFWETPPITADFAAAKAGKCRRTSERTMRDGEILTLDGRFQTFIFEHAATNILMVQATVKRDHAPLRVDFDHGTHAYLGCRAADDSASRIQMIATLLGKLDCAAALPVLADFLDDPNFFVRWHVMREMLGLDAEAALPHLRKMALTDPHPETRRAARTVLDRLEYPDRNRKAA